MKTGISLAQVVMPSASFGLARDELLIFLNRLLVSLLRLLFLAQSIMGKTQPKIRFGKSGSSFVAFGRRQPLAIFVLLI